MNRVLTFLLALLSLSFCSYAWGVAATTTNSEPISTPGSTYGTAEALADFCELAGHSVEISKAQEALNANGINAASLTSLHLVGVGLGLPVQSQDATLDELRHHGGPVLIQLHHPDGYVVLAAIGKEYALGLDNGRVGVVPLDEVVQRYTGHSLLLTDVSESESGVVIDEPIVVAEVTVTQGQFTKTVNFSNRSKKPLSLDVESVSCGCTSAELSQKVLKPGENSRLTLNVQLSGWGGKTVTVAVRTDDPLWPRVFVTVQVETPKGVLPVPSELPIQVREGDSTTRPVSIFLPDKSSLTHVSARNAFIKVVPTGNNAIAGGGIDYHFDVTVGSDAPPGLFADDLVFALKDAPLGEVHITIEGNVEPDLRANPEQAFLNGIVSGKTGRVVISLNSHLGRNFSITSVASHDSRVSGASDSSAMASSHDVRVEVKATGEPGTVIQDHLDILLSTGRTIRIPVTAMIEKASTINSTGPNTP